MPSTVISNMIYYPDTNVLRIFFQSGSIYDYMNVPASVYAAMKKSGAKGTYLNNYIKDRFEFQKIA